MNTQVQGTTLLLLVATLAATGGCEQPLEEQFTQEMRRPFDVAVREGDASTLRRLLVGASPTDDSSRYARERCFRQLPYGPNSQPWRKKEELSITV